MQRPCHVIYIILYCVGGERLFILDLPDLPTHKYEKTEVRVALIHVHTRLVCT